MGILLPVGGGQLGQRTIALGGAGGALSNGAIAIGGVSWAVYGVGAGQSVVGIYATVADIVKNYDGDLHDLTAAIDTYAATTYGEETTGVVLRKADSFGGSFYNFVFQYRGSATTNRFFQAQSQCGTSPVTDQEAGAASYSPRRIIMRASNTVTTGGMLNTSLGGDFYNLASCTRGGHEVTVRENYSGAAGFGTGDIIQFGLRDYAGTATGAVEQTASGLQISLGAFVLRLSHVHLAAQVPR